MRSIDLLSGQVQKLEKEIVRLCRGILEIPSPSCREGELVQYVSSAMEEAGFEEVRIDRLGSVVGRVGRGERVLLIDAHLDTVAAGDPSIWPHDPFKGKVENGRIFGLGAVDQKAVMASMIAAGMLIRTMGLQDRFSIFFTGTCLGEACDGLPLLQLIEREGLRPDFVVITEATDMQVYRGHRGRLELKLIARGRSAHASDPTRGVNAVYRVARILEQIGRLDRKLKPSGFLGKGTIAVTGIESAAPAPNAVPDECTLFVDRRITTGETRERALEQLESLPAVREVQATVETTHFEASSYTGMRVCREKHFPAWELPADHVLVRAAAETAELSTGRAPAIGHWSFGTGGSATMGLLGIPTVGFGPGREDLAHTTDEYVELDHLLQATAFYAALPGVLGAKLDGGDAGGRR